MPFLHGVSLIMTNQVEVIFKKARCFFKDTFQLKLEPAKSIWLQEVHNKINGPRQANLVLIAYASSEGSGEPAHPRSLARTFAARSYKQ